MKTINIDIEKVAQRKIYSSVDVSKPINKIEYEKKVNEFMLKLNELEEEYNLKVVADYIEHDDGGIECDLVLLDNINGFVVDYIIDDGE